jgi:hypothetical protein
MLDRLGAPQDFKAPAIFLLAPGSAWMTGADIWVNGGQSSMGLNLQRSLTFVRSVGGTLMISHKSMIKKWLILSSTPIHWHMKSTLLISSMQSLVSL